MEIVYLLWPLIQVSLKFFFFGNRGLSPNDKESMYLEIELIFDIERVNGVRVEGDMLVSASGDSTLRVWDLRTASCVRVLEGIVFPVL